MGVQRLAADRRLADRRRPRPRTEPAAVVRGGHAARAADGDGRRSARSPSGCGGAACGPPAITVVGRGGGARGAAGVGRRRGRSRAGRSPSRGRARRRATLARRAARAGRARRAGARSIRIEPLAGPPLDPAPLRPRLPDEPQRRRGAVRAARRRRARRARARRRARRRDRPGHRARRSPRTASSPTWCPSASSPRRSWRRSRESPSRRALVARAREARDVLPEALRARGARGGRAGAVRDASPSRSPSARSRRRGRRLRHLHLLLDRALLPAGARAADGRGSRRAPGSSRSAR